MTLSHCSNDGDDLSLDTLETAKMITIQNLSFIPKDITARPGETVFFYNNDEHPHHILSQTNVDSFDNSQDFSTEPFDHGDVVAITLPLDAEENEVFYFYCRIFRSTLVTPTGSITIAEEL